MAPRAGGWRLRGIRPPHRELLPDTGAGLRPDRSRQGRFRTRCIRARARCTPVGAGCGYGASTTLMARAFGKSRFTGSDYHEESIIQARKRAADAALAAQVRFEGAS